MKTFVTFIFGIFMIASAIAQEKPEKPEKVEKPEKKETQSGPVMTFEDENHDFGDIHQGDKVQYIFNFENTGNEPLVISNVQVTCGCTATEWPRDPIAPGAKSSLTISFNSAGKMGKQTKVITIVSNANNPRNRVTIYSNVLPKEGD